MLSLIIVLATIILLILSILFFPTIKIGKIKVDSYWVIALIGAIILIASKSVSLDTIKDTFMSNSSINPIKILILFISMTILSIFLDEIGLFKYIALKSANYLKSSQIKLFLGFYILISILTVFTSNDIIILTFTPFICYYCKNANIKPTPYLISEFVAANTWSMFLMIGNPTNIYLASAFNINFVDYIKNMALPTLVGSIVSLIILLLIFYKSLKPKMQIYEEKTKPLNKFLLTIGLLHLILCIILIAISSYLHFEMWLITLCFATSLILISLIYVILTKNKDRYIIKTLKRAPYSLIPFVISMFILVLALSQNGYLTKLQTLLKDNFMYYGLSGALIANLINNIPMSVLYSQVLEGMSLTSVYASIIASNIAAFITPLGALAGIMWMNLLKTYDIKMTFLNFVKYGIIIGIPTLLASLSMLFFI